MRKILTTTLLCILVLSLGLILFFSSKKDESFFQKISELELQKQINNGESINLYVYQNGCGKCTLIKEKLEKDDLNVPIHGLNLSELNDSTSFIESFQIKSTPTLLQFKDQELVKMTNDVTDEKDVLLFFSNQ